MKTRIADIKANPFRHMERYPIRRDKVDALRESLRTTGFWDNVVARIGADGDPEIAYGHHRLTALREEYDPGHMVNLIVRDLSDEDMLQIMARENMEEWGTSATVEHETVRAVVEAYGAGLIDLERPSPKTRGIRFAPNFGLTAPSGQMDHPYTAGQVADFLGWHVKKVQTALSALELVEAAVLSEDDFGDMSTEQARAMVQQTQRVRREQEAEAKAQAKRADDARKAAEQAETDKQREQAERRRKEAEAKAKKAREQSRTEAAKVGRGVGQAMRSGKRGYREAADEAAQHRTRRNGDMPDIDKFIDRLATKLTKVLDEDGKLAVELEAVIKHQASASDYKIDGLVDVLSTMERRVGNYRARLGAVESDATTIAGELGAAR